MKDIFNNFLEKILNEKKSFKLIAWIFIILIILSIIFYPIIDANFLYYNRTNKRIEIIQKMVNTLRKKNDIRAERASNFRDYSKQLNNQIALCIAVRNRMKGYVYDKEHTLSLPDKIYQNIKTGDIAQAQNVINELRSAVNKLENNRAQGTNTGHFLSRSYDDEKDKGGMER